MEDFNRNPCRYHIFDIFALDKSETDLRKIRAAIQATRDRLHFGKIEARDGTTIQLSEAEFNTLEKELVHPVERLKAEQLVHQAHAFSRDAELARCIESLANQEGDTLPKLLHEVQGQALLAVVKATIPLLVSSPLADDLPWPPEPPAYFPKRESREDAILREG